MRVKLYTNSDKTALYIEPIDFRLEELPRLSIYIMNMTGGFVDDGRCGVHITNSDINSVHSRIKTILEEKLHLSIELDESAGVLLREAQNESERFLIFSKIRRCRFETTTLTNLS